MTDLYQPFCDFWQKNKIQIFSTVIVSMLYVLPIVLANVYFIDDMGRIEEGYGLNGPGRFMATFFMKFAVSLNFHSTFNLYPFSIFIGAAIYGIVGVMVTYLLQIKTAKWISLSSLLMVTSPFLLENLSYRYDCITMALAVILVVLPYFLVQYKWIFVFFSAICVYLSFGFYQAGTMVYLALGLCLAINLFRQEGFKSFFMLVIKMALSFLIGFILYKISLSILHIQISDQGQMLSLSSDSKQTFFHNLEGYLGLMKTLFNTNNYKLWFGFFLVFGLIGLIANLIKSNKKTTEKISYFILSIIGVFGIFLLIGGISLVVNEAKWLPRVLMSFPFIFYLLLTFQGDFYNKYFNFFKNLSLYFLIYFSFLLNAQYGAVLKNKEEYSDFIMALVAPKLATLDQVEVVFNGKIQDAPRNKFMLENFPIINAITPKYEAGNWTWGQRRFNKFGLISSGYKAKIESSQLIKYPIIDKNKYYFLRYKDGLAIIDFEKTTD